MIIWHARTDKYVNEMAEFPKIENLSASTVFAPKTGGGRDTSQVDEEHTRKAIERLIENGRITPNDMISLNVESFKFRDDFARESAEMIKAARIIRELCPANIFGLYMNHMPETSYQIPLDLFHRGGINNAQERYEKWQSRNSRFLSERNEAGNRVGPLGLCDFVHVIHCSLYKYFDTDNSGPQFVDKSDTGWGVFAKHNIQQARMYQKPIVGWIWANVHKAAKHSPGKYIGDGSVRYQLDLLRDMDVSDVAIWFGGGPEMEPLPDSYFDILRDYHSGR